MNNDWEPATWRNIIEAALTILFLAAVWWLVVVMFAPQAPQ